MSKLVDAGRQIASADPQGVTVATPTADQVAGLTDGLTSLNARLESYLS